ncbi:MAG: hypothetical protein AAF974_12990 [Cyanobacteria bacterium P01_E01_bin.34]
MSTLLQVFHPLYFLGEQGISGSDVTVCLWSSLNPDRLFCLPVFLIVSGGVFASSQQIMTEEPH